MFHQYRSLQWYEILPVDHDDAHAGPHDAQAGAQGSGTLCRGNEQRAVRAVNRHQKGRLYHAAVRHSECRHADVAVVHRRTSAAAAAESVNRHDRTARRSGRRRSAAGRGRRRGV